MRNGLPGSFCLLVQRLLEQLKEFDHQVHEIENQIVAWHRANENSRKLAKMPGIGPISASAMVASLGDAKSFKNGRQVSAWLGLAPKQNSTGGKTVLLGMSKRGGFLFTDATDPGGTLDDLRSIAKGEF